MIYLELGLPGLNLHTIKGQDISDIENGRITLNAIQPIPITPEWLERCGFEKQDDGSCNVQIGNTIYLEFSRDLICSITPGVWFDYACKTRSEIKYLHQLQNIYFDLAGEELTINNQVCQTK